MRKFIHKDGTPVGHGECVSPDHVVQTFVVEIRSLNGISAETLNSLIQNKHEVTRLEVRKSVVIVQ